MNNQKCSDGGDCGIGGYCPECPRVKGSGASPCSDDYADNPQYVRMEDGHPVMRCSECETEYNTGSQGITTSDELELCIGCQADLRHLYDEDWNILQLATTNSPQ